jgi:polyphosphate kinase
MPRNFDRRIEVLVPIEDEAARARLLDEIMAANRKDEKQSWTLRPDGIYERVPAPPDAFSAHEFFLEARAT